MCPKFTHIFASFLFVKRKVNVAEPDLTDCQLVNALGEPVTRNNTPTFTGKRHENDRKITCTDNRKNLPSNSIIYMLIDVFLRIIVFQSDCN